MATLLNEILREGRWALSSRLLLTVILASAAFAAWSASTDVGNAQSSAAQFERTASNYASAGESVEEALVAPLNVTNGDNGQTEINNPVRFDFEAAVAASAAMSPLGASATALSLGLFVFMPALSYTIGLFAATTELKSGAIIVRWPQIRAAKQFVAAKLALLLFVIVVSATSILVFSTIGGAITSSMQPLAVGALSDGASPGSAAVGGLYLATCLIGTTFALLGFAIATLSRERVFSLTAFVLIYYLLPILGEWDIRNLIPSMSELWLAFYGGFQPRAVGDVSPIVAAVILIGVAIAALAASGWLWRIRDKTPANL